MIQLRFLNLIDGKKFELTYESIYKARLMYIKCQHSKKLRCVGVITDIIEDYLYITTGR